MKDKKIQRRPFLGDQSGATALLFVICAIVLMGFVALAVDIGRLIVVNEELQNAADACALAGARGFFSDSLSQSSGPVTIDPNPVQACATANAFIANNSLLADNQSLGTLSNVQAVIWNYATRQPQPSWSWPPLTLGGNVGPAVSLTVLKQGALNNGPVQNFLASIFGVDTSDAGRQAVAGLTGVGGFAPGAGIFPVAIKKDALSNFGQLLTFSPDTSNNAAWTGMADGANPPTIKQLMVGTLQTVVPADSMINLINGQTDLINYMVGKGGGKGGKNALYNLVETPSKSGIYIPSTSVFVTCPVVDKIQLNQSTPIVGGAYFQLIQVRDSTAGNTITVKLVEGAVDPKTFGGGAYYGVLSPNPVVAQ